MASKKSKKESIFLYILMFFLICYSGNPYFVYAEKVREGNIIFALIMLVLCLGKYRKILEKYVLYVLPLIFIMLIHEMFMPLAKMSTNIFMLLKMFIGVSVVCYLGKKFTGIFVNIMTTIGVISLIGFIYNIFFGLIPNAIQINNISSSLIIYTQLAETPRNCGMFWEPGAYQGFLNLALFLMLIENDISRKRWKAYILIACILTTVSTTGYVILAFVAYFYALENSKLNTTGKWGFLLVLLIMSYYAFFNLDFLGDKISASMEEDNLHRGRIGEYVLYADLFKKNMWLGMSYNDEIASGNGFFYQLISIGIVGTSYLMIYLYNRMRKKITPKFALFFLIFTILLFQGEVFVTYPLFMALPFINFSSSNSKSTKVA